MNFLKSVFSEPDGTGSASRVLMLLHFLAVAFWVSYYLHQGHSLGDVPWTGITLFVSTPYAINKGSQALSAVMASAPKS